MRKGTDMKQVDSMNEELGVAAISDSVSGSSESSTGGNPNLAQEKI